MIQIMYKETFDIVKKEIIWKEVSMSGKNMSALAALELLIQITFNAVCGNSFLQQASMSINSEQK